MDNPNDKPFFPKQAVPFDLKLFYKEFVRDAGERLAAASLEQIPGISAGAVIHDIGCGVGAATASLLAAALPGAAPTIRITGTDVNEAAVDAYRSRASENAWPADALVMDAKALAFPDNTFTHTIGSAMIFLLGGRDSSITAVREMYRTLQPGGTLVLNCFASANALGAVRAASRQTRTGGKLPSWTSFEDWQDPAVLAGIVEAGGFDRRNMTVLQCPTFVSVGDFDRHVAMTWSFRGETADGWSQEDEDKWDEAVAIVKREFQESQGFQMLDDGSAIVRNLVNVVIATK